MEDGVGVAGGGAGSGATGVVDDVDEGLAIEPLRGVVGRGLADVAEGCSGREDGSSVAEGDGLSALNAVGALDLEAADGLGEDAVGSSEEGFVPSEGEFVDAGCGHHAWVVAVRDAVPGLGVSGVEEGDGVEEFRLSVGEAEVIAV